MQLSEMYRMGRVNVIINKPRRSPFLYKSQSLSLETLYHEWFLGNSANLLLRIIPKFYLTFL